MNKFVKQIIGILIIILVWQFVSWADILNPIYFASPLEVFNEVLQMFQSNGILLDLLFTFYRIIVSMIIASLVGIPLGIILGYFSNIYEYIGEFVDFLRSIPPIVIYPLLLIVVGTGDASRIGVALFGAIVVLILIISKGMFLQSPLRQKYIAALGANKKQVLKHVIWYEALPHIMIALRTAVSLTIIIVVVTEMLVGARYGLGTRVQNVQITSNIPDLFATIIIIGLIGIILNKILISIDQRLVFWKQN